ncbi:IL3RB protein, partial [Caloenas nicobarica]|nr:IL3RB protein [Caloenas nicobarica]
ESIPMKSLSCYNDYNSQVTCTWMEHSEAHALVGMTLYQRDNIIMENKEMFCKRQTENDLDEVPESYVHWVCINTTDNFGIGVDDIYSFRPDKMLQAELNVDLFQNARSTAWQHVHLPSHAWDCWEMEPGSHLLSLFACLLPLFSIPQLPDFLPPFPQQQKAASLLLSNTTRCHLSCKDLVPGSSYVARVRARPGRSSGFSGQFSEWSTEVSWETPEGGLQPRNLRCLFNGADRLTCSWEVKKAIITSVIFGLFFRATPASAEEECSPVQEKSLPHVPYVVQSCEIPVSNSSSQSQYHVSVQVKTEEKLIEAYKNIKVLPPANVSV